KRLAPISGVLYPLRRGLSDTNTCCLSQLDVSRFARVSHAHVRDASLRRSPRALVCAIERSRCEPAAAWESVRRQWRYRNQAHRPRPSQLRRVRAARTLVDGISGGNAIFDLSVARARLDAA